MRVTLTAVLLLVLSALVAPAADAATYRLNPASNIAVPGYVFDHCESAPTSHTCTAALVKALDHARSVLHEPQYTLPARFAWLAPVEQLLVLSNQDRALYRRTPISGVNSTLNTSAAGGVRDDADPNFVYTVDHQPLRGGSANWAGGGYHSMRNPLLAYYLWMYDDGPGSGNLDCAKAGDPGCWGHRDGTIANFGGGLQVLMGAAGGKDRSGLQGWTELFEAFAAGPKIRQVPVVTGLSRYSAAKGQTVTITGFGLAGATTVTVAGHAAAVTKRSVTALTFTVPAGSGKGYVVVHEPGGTSRSSYASAFAYRG